MEKYKYQIVYVEHGEYKEEIALSCEFISESKEKANVFAKAIQRVWVLSIFDVSKHLRPYKLIDENGNAVE